MSTYLRLSVNINDECADVLRDSMARHGVTATEVTRRALGLLAMAERGDLTHGLCNACDELLERCGAYQSDYGFTCVIPVREHGGNHLDRAGGWWNATGQVGAS